MFQCCTREMEKVCTFSLCDCRS